MSINTQTNVRLKDVLVDSQLKKKPIYIQSNGRTVAYIGRFSPWWIVRWLRKKIWGEEWPK